MTPISFAVGSVRTVAGIPLRVAGAVVPAPDIGARFDDLLEELGARLDDLLEGPLVETAGRALARHDVPRRLAAELLVEYDPEELAAALLASPVFARVLLEATDTFLRSVAMQHAIEHLAASPELRRAMAEQSAGVVEHAAESVRRRSVVLDDTAEQTVRGWLRRPRPQVS